MKNESLAKAILTIACLITGLAIIGTQDYNDKRAADCQKNGMLYDRQADKCRGEK